MLKTEYVLYTFFDVVVVVVFSCIFYIKKEFARNAMRNLGIAISYSY